MKGCACPRPPAPASGGFTLTEILITLAFAPLFAGLVYSFVQSSSRAARVQQALSESQDTAYLAMSVLLRDLRQAGYGSESAPPVGLAGAQTGSVALRADLNLDGDTGDAGEAVSYQEDGARHTLTRTAGAAAPQPLADHLAAGSLRFVYYDLDGARLDPGGGLGLEPRRRVKRVDVSFAIALADAAPVPVSASVEMRNVR